MADEKEIKKSTGYDFGYIGPIDLGLEIYFDHAVAEMPSLICGANEKDYHFVDANFSDDLGNPDTIDLSDLSSASVTLLQVTFSGRKLFIALLYTLLSTIAAKRL